MNFKKFFKKKEEVPLVDPRMYVLVRADLPHGLQCAQACHAASYLAANNPLMLYQHPTTIVLNVDSEVELDTYAVKTGRKGFMFKEPDLNYQSTAYAFYSEVEMFKELPLAMKEEM